MERESSNYQRLKQAISHSEQFKWALKTLEALISTLVTTCTKDEDGTTSRQTRVANTLKEILDIMRTTNWCRMELKEKIDKHIQKAEEMDK